MSWFSLRYRSYHINRYYTYITVGRFGRLLLLPVKDEKDGDDANEVSSKLIASSSLRFVSCFVVVAGTVTLLLLVVDILDRNRSRLERVVDVADQKKDNLLALLGLPLWLRTKSNESIDSRLDGMARGSVIDREYYDILGAISLIRPPRCRGTPFPKLTRRLSRNTQKKWIEVDVSCSVSGRKTPYAQKAPLIHNSISEHRSLN